MSILKGRPGPKVEAGNPEENISGNPDETISGFPEKKKPRKAAQPRSDDEMVKVSTILRVAQHRQLKIVAAQQGIRIEEAFREAVDRYLKKF